MKDSYATGLNQGHFVIPYSPVCQQLRTTTMYLQSGHLKSAYYTFISEKTTDVFQLL